MVFTSEAVTKGHPDKVCDQIADAILDACFSQDKDSHVACEVCCTTGTIVLMGEISTKANVNYKQVARGVLKSIGYTNPEYGIDYSSCSVIDLIDKQSPEINNAVNNALGNTESNPEDYYNSQGAGDQGIIFGYACKETEVYMPLSIYLAHELSRRLEYVREKGILPWVRPDGKTQVSIKYSDAQDEEVSTILSIDTILISTQHDPGIDMHSMRTSIILEVITHVLYKLGLTSLWIDETKIIINPSGSFTIGGPQGDTGLTGRKLAVDTYGGHAKFGGGAMCGKDPSKVDRSAAYMARYIAKHLVASGLCDKCEVQLSYAIGKAKPVSINVNTYGTSPISDSSITDLVNKVFDCRPLAIIDKLCLKDYNYSSISGKCQFGNEGSPWEIINPSIIANLQSFALDS